MNFWKGHALGNDYIVIERPPDQPPPAELVRWLCDRHRGIGGDGILVSLSGQEPQPQSHRLRIFNPDGGEAEKSGNGLRIFGAWLHHIGRVGSDPFQVALPAETVELSVVDQQGATRVLTVAMGRASFRAGDVGYSGAPPDAEVLGTELPPFPDDPDEPTPAVHLVSVGNPHCVLFSDLTDQDFRAIAPRVQKHPAFSRGINVQLARVTGPRTIEARIWERGAGETTASGSSACAVAAAAVRTGRIEPGVLEVRMPGGAVEVEVGEGFEVRLTGEAVMVYSGELNATIDNR